MQYRRAFSPGGVFFFTLVTEKRRPLFDDVNNIGMLGEAFRAVRRKRPFRMDAVVVLPDHLHSLWTLPPNDSDFSTRWRLIKTWFTKHYREELRTPPNAARQNKNQQALWQHRFWEHTIRDDVDLARHMDYIHYNPVKHGYVSAPVQWPYSSFHRHVAAGVYPADWGSGEMRFEGIGYE
uniref:Putative transposase n=1 Tax=Candidatus Kentrum sp. FM TaxID=2126340 RepID=A0A450SE18_9GAMM|nr:MAG: putative transposase [Candidatus Kentron sp. FM]VFJ50810.1 MAG: putative transposase [Candidatus Kentron sp. FM]VFK10356.1 MAG: putative transposase [Candidatus Kentron sp. FM]